jgi:hypothetical protein
MIPLLHELARFLRYLFTPETQPAAIQYDGSAAGAVKAGFWTLLAIIAGIALGRMLA